MPINPDPFYLVRQNAPKPTLTLPDFLSSLPLESTGPSRGILFVSSKEVVYKELGQIVSARSSGLGRSFAFRFADFSVNLEGEHLVRLFELINQERLRTIVITSVEIIEPQPEKKGGDV